MLVPVVGVMQTSPRVLVTQSVAVAQPQVPLGLQASPVVLVAH
jgi:hypothetical protein